jgi:hypothetical protein
MNNPMSENLFKKVESQMQPALFVQWLEMLLQYEQGRALINAQLQRYELPTIELEPA